MATGPSKVLLYEACIGATPLNVVVDTGATTNWIDAAMTTALHLTVYSTGGSPAMSLNNASIVPVGSTTAVLQICNHNFPTGFNVATLPANCHVILGCDWLAQQHGVVDIADGCTKLRNPRQPTQHIVWAAARRPAQRCAPTRTEITNQAHAAVLETNSAPAHLSHQTAAESRALHGGQ